MNMEIEKAGTVYKCEENIPSDEKSYQYVENNRKNSILKGCIKMSTKFRYAAGHVCLLVALMMYTACGGLIFRQLELPAEIARLTRLRTILQEQRHRLVWSIVNNTDVSNFETLVKVEISIYEEAIQEAAESGLLVHNSNNWDNANEVTTDKWNVFQAIFFASTVLTTIGYGNVVPLTLWGRIFCILFALIGIPLTVTVIADWGKLLAEVVSIIDRKVKLKFPQNIILHMPSNLTGKRSLGALAAVAFLFIYLSFGAAMFMLWEEDWTFFEGFYFCFVTMTTIGFGDVVPKRPKYMLLCTLYILVGLALTSTIIELVRRQYESSWRRLQSLRGTLAETLKKLGDQYGGEMSLLNSDLKRVLTAMSMPRMKRSSTISQGTEEKEWEETIKEVIDSISNATSLQQSPKKPAIQIIIYESSV